MPRILFINSVCNGSTGTICKNLYKAAEKEEYECCFAYGRGIAPVGFNTIKIGNKLDIYSHVAKARLFDASGFGSKHATKEFIKEIEKFKPEIIHMHNLHGYYLNIEILFQYLKQHPEIKKIWTLHDCWAFTGHCAYYSYAQCNQWQKGCKGKCPNKKEYPKTLIGNCENNFKKKKEIFSGLKNIVLVSPSVWLKEEIKHSFLKCYPVKVINNGVDTNVFKPTESNIKEEYGIDVKKVILGVASVWDKRKGLDSFIELSKKINTNFQIVLIGLSNSQIKELPNSIIGINRTENVEELVKWYSAADVYFNPTLEDNYPTTNIEAIACGTPVITFNTGGSPESCLVENVVSSKTYIDVIKNKKYNSARSQIKSLDDMNKNYCMIY